jgi:hypothetical protein
MESPPYSCLLQRLSIPSVIPSNSFISIMEVHDFSLLEDSDGEFLELGGSSSIDNSCNYDYLGYDLGRGWS